ncbi:EAL domain-containing protein [Bacillus sp. SCS-153A]|uniref:EAL domain-containing protein n=1 Tax=Rossellomorea sedimentorum TaxID=3115294 RepID=UPI0039058FDF
MVKLKSIIQKQRKLLKEGKLENMEESLKDFYELSFKSYPEPIFILDKTGQIIVYNDAVQSLFGEQSIKYGKNLLNKLNPDQQSTDWSEFFYPILNGHFQSFNTQLTNKKGNTIESHVKLTPTKFSPKDFIISGIITDISELTLQKEQAENLEIRLNTAQQLADIGTWEYDIAKDECSLSYKVHEILGIPNGIKPTFHMLTDTVHPQDRHIFADEFVNAVNEKRNFHSQNRVIRPDGTERMLQNYGEIIYDADKKPSKFIGTTYDITEQKVIEERLAETERQVLRISNTLEVGIWAKDIKKNQFLFVSKGVELLSGYSPEDFRRGLIEWEDLIYPDDYEQYKLRQEKLKDGKVPKEQYRIIQRNGEIRWVQDEIITTYNSLGDIVRIEGIISDISEQKETEEKVNYIAHHDYLTDLPNRRMFERKLQTIIQQSKIKDNEFAVMYVDMDGFKRVNDTLGHAIGDKLLIEISNRLLACIPKNYFVARIGGDEFSVIIEDMQTLEQTTSTAKKIISTLEVPYKLDGYELFVTASVGVATYPHDGLDEQSILQKADKALYRAKEMGKNNFQIYNSSMNIEAYKLYSLENDLRKAIKKKELSFRYQPKIDARNGRMIGAEALIRWEHPEWGQVSPVEFIPLAEENDLIFKLTNWTFRTICTQIKQWSDQKIPVVPISINISPKLFIKSEWQDELIDILQETNIDPKLVELEITEQALIKNEESFSLGIEKLKQLGIKISLDDFGTGYSSLLYLQKFKLDTIKIDKSFVDDILKGKPTITKAIINMAHEFDMTVIAEGVETREQQSFLKKQGCDQFQGYLYSKPVLPEEIENLFHLPILEPKGASESQPAPNRRQFFRVELPLPLSGNMTIVKIKDKDIKLGKSEVLIENIGPGGLRFLTHINLPLNPDIILGFETEILGDTRPFYGYVVWKEEQTAGIFEYGIQFKFTEGEQSKITALTSKLQTSLKKTSKLHDTRFIREDKIDYINNKIRTKL